MELEEQRSLQCETNNSCAVRKLNRECAFGLHRNCLDTGLMMPQRCGSVLCRSMATLKFISDRIGDKTKSHCHRANTSLPCTADRTLYQGMSVMSVNSSHDS